MRAVTYLRVSDSHQVEKGLSIPAQRRLEKDAAPQVLILLEVMKSLV